MCHDYLLVNGEQVALREINEDDATFVLSLRCDDKKSKYLHSTKNDLLEQIKYIQNYYKNKDGWYFIILRKKTNERIGTYRIYDIRRDSFCIGSWIMVDGITSGELIESDYLIRSFGFNKLKTRKLHFDVRKGNKKVIRYHMRFGARIITQSDEDVFFECYKEDCVSLYQKKLYPNKLPKDMPPYVEVIKYNHAL